MVETWGGSWDRLLRVKSPGSPRSYIFLENNGKATRGVSAGNNVGIKFLEWFTNEIFDEMP